MRSAPTSLGAKKKPPDPKAKGIHPPGGKAYAAAGISVMAESFVSPFVINVGDLINSVRAFDSSGVHRGRELPNPPKKHPNS